MISPIAGRVACTLMFVSTPPAVGLSETATGEPAAWKACYGGPLSLSLVTRITDSGWRFWRR